MIKRKTCVGLEIGFWREGRYADGFIGGTIEGKESEEI